MDKTEFPTEDRISQLRNEGIVAISLLTIRLIGVLIYFITLYLVLKSFWPSFQEYLMTNSLENFQPNSNSIHEYIWPITGVVCIPILALIGTSFLIGMIQTKFLFRWANVEISFSRFFSNSRSMFYMPFNILKSIFVVLAISIFALFISWFFVKEILRDFLSILNYDREGLLPGIFKIFNANLPFLALTLMIIAIFSWLFVRYKFRLLYRMTRKEIEEELSSR